MISPITHLSTLAAAILMATPALALEAWNGQEGSDTFEVIFDSQVWQNAWWVGASHCPGEAQPNDPNNPWRVVRAATAAEMTQYGNPTTCDTSGGGGETLPDFDASQGYRQGDKVTLNGGDYLATADVPAYSFQPAQASPWAPYLPLPSWQSSTVYNKGDRVLLEGQGYEALFWTQGDDPSDPANQNPEGNNGRPWKPLGPMHNYTDEELAQAPQLDTSVLYPADTLVQFEQGHQVSRQQVRGVRPGDLNPWQGYVEWGNVKEQVGTPKHPWPAQVYAPYLDATLNSVPNMGELAQQQGVDHFTLAFVVAKDAQTCVPTWGTYYKMGDFPSLYSNIKGLRDQGGDVMVSIGGAANAPLAAACDNIDELARQYMDIVDNLNLQVLDFDIEGTWVADAVSIARRSQALVRAQAQWAAQGKQVAIWYTLPILPQGLTADGIKVLQSARDHGVKLTGINVMTMDYGDSACPPSQGEGANIQGQCGVDAINNLFRDVKAIFPEKEDAAIWAMLGTTPMIGVNDVQSEVFYRSDAALTLQHAQEQGIGMIGIWSIARDQPGTAGQVSPEHSGLTEAQSPRYGFSALFKAFTQR